jgi:o-succinylbenzoate synthase
VTPVGDTPRIARVTWAGVRVPFVRPFATAHGAMTHREGLIITLEAEGGLSGVGEATPWPAFGLGDVADTARVFAALAPRLPGLPADRANDAFAGQNLAAPGVAAARCGLDLAAHDLIGKAQGAPVAALLGGDPATVGDDGVPVNATIGALSPDEAAEAARRAVAAGFTCAKVKVAAGSLAEDDARVAAVRAAGGPDVLVRIDANGAWSEAEAIAAIERLSRHDLELVEQPVAADDFASLARVRRAVSVPIAADEAVRTLDDARRIVASGAADLLVVKPMVCGGLAAGRAILKLAAEAGLGAFVTTTIDFGPGIAGALALSRSMGQAALHCGLATSGLLESPLVRDLPAVVGGRMVVPQGAGLGVTLDPESVLRYRVGLKSL